MTHDLNQWSRAQLEMRTMFDAGRRQVVVMRWLVFFLVLAVGSQSFTIHYLAQHQGFVPWVVELNGFQEVRSFGEAERVVGEDRLVQLHLQKFVQSLRTVAREELIRKQLFLDTARYVAEGRKLDARYLYSEDGRLDGHWSRVILIRTVLKVEDGVWEVTWLEDVIEKSRVARSEWRGLFTVEMRRMSDPGVMSRNPFGFVVLDWHMQPSSVVQEFNVGEQKALF